VLDLRNSSAKCGFIFAIYKARGKRMSEFANILGSNVFHK
jgi:hypothetical protein